jgi:hypothetical protein
VQDVEDTAGGEKERRAREPSIAEAVITLRLGKARERERIADYVPFVVETFKGEFVLQELAFREGIDA